MSTLSIAPSVDCRAAGRAATGNRASSRRRRPRLDSLTQLRFFAAMYVVIFHYGIATAANHATWIFNIQSAGYIAVGLFFVLSGFVLAYTYMDRAAEDPLDRTNFWIARFSRIYPAYLIALTLSVALLAYDAHKDGVTLALLIHWVEGIVASVLMVQAWLPQVSDTINFPGWSLSAEAFFYVVFPFIAPWIARRTSDRLFKLAVILRLASFVVPLSYVILNPEHLSASVQTNGPGGRLWSKLTWMKVVAYNPLVRLPEFLIGVVAGILYNRHGALSVRNGRVLAFGSVLLVVLIVAQRPPVPYVLLHNALLTPLFAAMIYGLASVDSFTKRDWAFPGAALLLLLGEASYSIYILQEPIHIWAIIVGVHASRGAPIYTYPAFFLAFAMMLIIASIASLKLFEHPLRSALRKRLSELFVCHAVYH